MSSHLFSDIESARGFALAGNAILTISSLKTGNHYTYKVRKKESTRGGNLWFVSRLVDGSADQGFFAYTGIIRDGRFSVTAKAGISEGAPCVQAFAFFMRTPVLHPQMEVRHEGRCGVCGRTLTVPASIDRGIGPECAQKGL